MLFGCAPISTKDVVLHETTPEMRAIYKPYQEVGFCLNPDTGNIYNIHYGTWMTSPLPICYQNAIIMHSHVSWEIPFADIWDWLVWKEYKGRYGNEYYGIMKLNWYKVYRIGD